MKIYPETRAWQQSAHQEPEHGVATLQLAPLIVQLAQRLGARTVCDYGAGSPALRDALEALDHWDLDFRVHDPDPAGHGAPEPAEIVCCIDVLARVAPDNLPAVLVELARITTRIGLFCVRPAPQSPTGERDAGGLRDSVSWWRTELSALFEIIHLERMEDGFYVIVQPRRLH